MRLSFWRGTTTEQLLAGIARLLLAVFALLFTFSLLGMIWHTSILPGLFFLEPILKTGALIVIAVLALGAIVYIVVRIRNHQA